MIKFIPILIFLFLLILPKPLFASGNNIMVISKYSPYNYSEEIISGIKTQLIKTPKYHLYSYYLYNNLYSVFGLKYYFKYFKFKYVIINKTLLNKILIFDPLLFKNQNLILYQNKDYNKFIRQIFDKDISLNKNNEIEKIIVILNIKNYSKYSFLQKDFLRIKGFYINIKFYDSDDISLVLEYINNNKNKHNIFIITNNIFKEQKTYVPDSILMNYFKRNNNIIDLNKNFYFLIGKIIGAKIIANKN